MRKARIAAMTEAQKEAARAARPRRTAAQNAARRQTRPRGNRRQRASPGEMGANFSRTKEALKRKKKQAEEAATQRLNPGTLACRGCVLFFQFERFHLIEQNRCEDQNHNEFIKSLSRGEPISIEYIGSMKHLTRQDIQDHPRDWKFAPVLVSTNMERVKIARFKAQLWAQEHKTYVFKWKVRIGKEVNRPSLEDMEQIREDNAFFWQFFVKGAPYHLTQGVNNDLAMVNGSPLKGHSLTLADKEEHDRIVELLKGSDAPPFGSEIEIQEPAAINMIVEPSLDGQPLSTLRKAQLAELKKHSLFRGKEIVVPITTSMGNNADHDKFVYRTNNLLTPIAVASVRDPFPVQSAFSMTIHKAQGRTIKRMVVDLTWQGSHNCRMEYAAVFVALSRVASKDHIRLLRHAKVGRMFDPEEAYGYLAKLKPARAVAAFYHGFVPRTGRGTTSLGEAWNPERALSCPVQ